MSPGTAAAVIMEPRLVADLLLRLGHDPPRIVAELCRWCWEEEGAGPLIAARVDVLRLLLDELCWRREARGLGLQWQGLRELAEQRCLPLLRTLRLEEPGERRLALSLCGLLLACCRLARPELLEQVAASCLRELRAYSEQRSGAAPAPGAEYSDIRVVVEMLVKLWPLVSERDSGTGAGQLLPLALTALRIGEDGVAATVVTGLIPALLEQESVTVWDIWDRVRLWESPCSVSRLLLLLSSLSSSVSLDLRTCTDFWKVVQAGLVQPDNTTRKRALYLLKRAVDVSGALEKDIALDYQTENGILKNSSPFVISNTFIQATHGQCYS